MNSKQLWKEFCEKSGIDENSHYEAWAFGGAPDKLVDLVLQGIKTATSSAYDLYFIEGEKEPMPKVNDYSVILNSKEEALCVIRTTKLLTVPFKNVGAEHAYKEGEGDLSLAYWREVHDEFFRKEFADCGLEFDYDRKIVLEEFEVCYRKEL